MMRAATRMTPSWARTKMIHSASLPQRPRYMNHHHYSIRYVAGQTSECSANIPHNGNDKS
eukprot:scaffold342254_cov35-Attheya_sp.AAC.1